MTSSAFPGGVALVVVLARIFQARTRSQQGLLSSWLEPCTILMVTGVPEAHHASWLAGVQGAGDFVTISANRFTTASCQDFAFGGYNSWQVGPTIFS